MKKIVTVVILFCLLISCERKEPNFSEEMIEKLSHRDKSRDKFYTPIPYPFSDVYLMTNKNEILATDENSLHASYKLFYLNEYKSYKMFLETFLDKDFVFDEKSKLIFFRKFKLDSKMEKEYAELGFDKFLEKHSKSRKGELELNKTNLKNYEYSTIVYLLYINKYDLSQSCLNGRDYIIKREKLFLNKNHN